MSPFITDTFLESIARLLSNLDHFHIAGCPELETRGVWALLSTNKRGLLSLSLEELSARFVIHLRLSFFQPFSYIEDLSLLSASHTPQPLRRLRSITLSMPFPLLLVSTPQQRFFFRKPSQISLVPALLRDSRYTVRRYGILDSRPFHRRSFCWAT